MTHSRPSRRFLSAAGESTCDTVSFGVLGCAAACGLAPPNNASAWWPTAEGEILERWVRESRGGKTGQLSFAPRISYRYAVGAASYTGARSSGRQSGTSWRRGR